MPELPHVWAPTPASPVTPLDAPPTISVIIAAYQAASVIGDAVESLLAQTVLPDEIVVCDDGSTDDLASALRPYRDRITLLTQENGGEAVAKNAAASASSSELVLILDADDLFLPTRIEALGELARQRPDLDILTSDAWLEANGQTVGRCYGEHWPFAVDDQPREILRRNFVFGLAAVRRRRLLEVGGFDPAIRYTADWDCWLRLVRTGSRVGAVAEPLAVYRLTSTSLAAQRLRMVDGRLQTMTKALEEDPTLDAGERDVLREAIAVQRRERARLAARDALAAGRPGVRAALRRIAADSSAPPADRLRAAVAAVFPGVAGRLLRRRDQKAFIGPGGVRIARPSAETAPTTPEATRPS